MLKKVLSLIWGSESSSSSALNLEEAYNVIGEIPSTPDEEPQENNESIDDTPSPFEIVQKAGTVTQIAYDILTIDNTYTWKLIADGKEQFSVGSTVSYKLMKENQSIKVIELNLLEDDWNVVDNTKRTWHNRVMIFSVSQKNRRNLTLSPGDVKVNLDTICAEFVPLVGDWVELDVKCVLDETVVDLSGQILEVNKLMPLRPQIKSAVITVWNKNQFNGQIDRNIYFEKESLSPGYVPVQGDKVIAEIIESNRPPCMWRALKVVPHNLYGKTSILEPALEDGDVFKLDYPGLEISGDVTLKFAKLGQSQLFSFEIENNTGEDIKLICLKFPNVNGQCTVITEIDHNTLKNKMSLTVRCECKVKCMGQSQETLIFQFDQFKMRRAVIISVTNETTSNRMQTGYNSRQYLARNTRKEQKFTFSRDEKREIIRGQGMSQSARFVAVRVPDFTLPQYIVEFEIKFRENPSYMIQNQEVERRMKFLADGLNFMNYENKFHTLVHLDEANVVVAMRDYDQARACFIRNGDFLLLEVENLAERRPSLVPGDRVIARNIHNNNTPDYEGHIHKIGKQHAFIKFSQMFHDCYKGEDYSIHVVASRATFRREHYAVQLAVRQLGRDWLFPSKVVEKSPQIDFLFDDYSDTLNSSNDDAEKENSPSRNPLPKSIHTGNKQVLLRKVQAIKEKREGGIVTVEEIDDIEKAKLKLEWHNESLNFFQKEAVRNILLGVCRPLPYIIFGPPGTGKTVTLVETILQILRLIPHSRLLVCAPSNSAADLIALRLIDSGVLRPGDLIRLVALSAVSSIPAKLAPYCATASCEKEGTESCMPIVTDSGLVLGYSSAVLGRHRITVSTCSSAGQLYPLGFPKGHFSHIIVDEAGQTTEPNVLIPLSFLDTSSGQAVLAGDPMQLGPVILSHFASQYGLEESFMERFISRFPYVRDPEGFPKTCGYDPRLITKLIYNYRSLPDLLKLPSFLFYNDELIPTVSPTDSKEADILNQLKEMLPLTNTGQAASMIFHGILGENFQTEDSPSWFNPNEAAQVFYYINELYRLGLKSTDIGVITPYKAQTKALQDLFKEADFDPPKTGTVEEFQGQEFNVVILSTVRSTKRYLKCDFKFALGFISHPRRLNVSITRAKSLLIIVGNPNLLITDRTWRSVINFCIEKGSFIGCPVNPKGQDY